MTPVILVDAYLIMLAFSVHFVVCVAVSAELEGRLRPLQALKPSDLAVETKRSCRSAGYMRRDVGGNTAACLGSGRRA